MSSITCSDCGLRFRFSREEDTCVCPNPQCCKEQATGMEGRIRKKIEKYVNLDLPPMTVGRAVGFAAAIYEFSTHNDRIDVGSIENRLQRKTGVATGMEKSSLKMIATRANGGLVDNRTGLMIYVISGTTGHTP